MCQKANLTLWMVATRRMWADETDPAKREMLQKIYTGFAKRLLAIPD